MYSNNEHLNKLHDRVHFCKERLEAFIPSEDQDLDLFILQGLRADLSIAEGNFFRARKYVILGKTLKGRLFQDE